jgi:hypothetical protein
MTEPPAWVWFAIGVGLFVILSVLVVSLRVV